MLSCTLFIVFIVSMPAFTHVVSDETNIICTSDEFACKDTSCVPLSSLCDGERDCLDGSDEVSCDGLLYPLDSEDLALRRSKRQASSCGKNQWQCSDGTCISFDRKCDGTTHCPDGSDEKDALCKKNKFQGHWIKFQASPKIVYWSSYVMSLKGLNAAGLDGTAPCNGVTECAHESDERLPKCRNETSEVEGRFRCASGQYIPASEHCNGIKNCFDGSDETVCACATKNCSSYFFQCAYGACVDIGSDCNGKQECADGSDEDEELCSRILSGTPKPPVTVNPIDKPTTPQGGKCVLPPFPEYGTYTMGGNPNASPGQNFPNVFLNITCNPGFGVERDIYLVYCFDGIWSNVIPKCVRFCRLQKHVSVEYQCRVTGSNSLTGSRECGEQEPEGTVVRPVCRAPNYYYSGILNAMRCVDGSWTYIAICTSECGTFTPRDEQLIIGGLKVAQTGELPWHAGIYTKETTPYMQICGGSLISTTTIISAAHCFWSDVQELLPAVNYAVAVGKIYRQYNNPKDTGAQKSDVTSILIPPRFRGSETNFQDDIALVMVAVQFTFDINVRPVCIDFDVTFEKIQLTDKTLGKVAGWGITAGNDPPASKTASQKLKVVEMPYVNIEDCFTIVQPSFRQFITSDKICAGYRNGTTLCKGDSGGGLAFPATELRTQRYYLRGVVSVAPRNENLCSADSLIAFTQITKHEHFIKEPNPPTPPQGGKCMLPPYPEYGTYTMDGNPNASPGQTFPNVLITITCNPGYGVESDINSLHCINGVWSNVMPKCVRFCRLQKHVSVEYQCRVTGSNSLTGSRECGEQEPEGTVVRPVCRAPIYYYSGVLSTMRCVDGSWTYIAICTPECGTITPQSTQLIVGGKKKVTKRGEMPWHAVVYSKRTTPYSQICGGSLISTKTIISAAHCFWTDESKLLPATNYAVAVGKIYRPYNDPNDTGAQKSDVANILIPPRFRGSATNFQEDIALVMVAVQFTFDINVRPVCIDFDVNFERKQLTDKGLGKVAGWSISVGNGQPASGSASEELKVVEIPYIKIEDCFAIVKPSFRPYITSDKICAGYTNGTTLCQGDSGSGLAFPATELGTQRYYLRGVVSTAPRNENRCSADSLIAFTQITNHEHFIKSAQDL